MIVLDHLFNHTECMILKFYSILDGADYNRSETLIKQCSVGWFYSTLQSANFSFKT